MDHERYMRRCLQLAAGGMGHTSPNPMVGSVIVHNDRIIGEGFHHLYGGPHAEVHAVSTVKDRSLLKDATLYVSLEPCAHFGKTPPCADLIIKEGIRRVVIATTDPFPKVDGSGISRLKSAGIDVITGVLEQEARFLNRRFFTFYGKKRPYIILKWAETADGYIDINRAGGEKGIKWITQPETQLLTHRWRTEEQAIAIGHNTLTTDDPSLTPRAYEGKPPVKIVMSREKTDLSGFAVSNGTAPYLVGDRPRDLVRFCVSETIISVLVEGGAATINKFLEEGLWDEARVLQGTLTFGSGKKAPATGGPVSKTDILPNGDRISYTFNPGGK